MQPKPTSSFISINWMPFSISGNIYSYKAGGTVASSLNNLEPFSWHQHERESHLRLNDRKLLLHPAVLNIPRL